MPHPKRKSKPVKKALVRRRPKSTAIMKPPPRPDPRQPALTLAGQLERVLIVGDLAQLTAEERIDYVKRLCQSLGLNILTRPFDYILFKDYDTDGPAKLTLYANKSCTEQLRKIHGVGIKPPLRREIDATRKVVMVEADAFDRTGKTDTATGLVSLTKRKKVGNEWKQFDLSDREYCNAIMKCETKAKRRATLSICGLGFLDETELDNMRVVGGVTPDGRIYRIEEDEPPPELSEDAPHGHAPGSEKAKQAEAAIKRVEEADRAAVEAKRAKVAPQAKEAPKTAPPPPAGEPLAQLEAEAVTPNEFILRGDISGRLYPMVEFLCKFKDGWWRCDLATLQKMQAIQQERNFKVTVLPSAKAPAKPKAAPPAAAVGPETVTGTIERTNMSMAGKSPVQYVTLLMTDRSKPTFGCFHKSMWDHIEAGKGQLATFAVVRKGKYANIEGLRRIGSKQWDEDGAPVLSVDREPGNPSLFK